MLSQCLRRLEADRVVTRNDLSDVILHVEYELHESIRDSVLELLDHLAKWGGEYVGPEQHEGREATKSVDQVELRSAADRSLHGFRQS